MASTVDTKILEQFQSKALLMTVDAPNMVIQMALQTTTVKEEIRYYTSQYSACLSAHPYD
jgi:hypothetical protein